MYAKSIIEHVRGQVAAGAWTKQLSCIPVVMALAVAALPFTLAPDFAADDSSSPSAEASAVESPANNNLVKATAAVRAALPDDRRYAIVAEYMARRFLVSRTVVQDLVKTAHIVGRQYNLDPTLLVAIMAVESSFNPIAESVAGAKGLMQIIPHYHQEKFTEFGGDQAVFEPRANIAVGAKIIREYLQASSGNLFTALQTYAGALPDRDAAYTHKVLNEKDRLDALMGLPKTARVGQPVPQPASVVLQPASGDHIQMTLPPTSPVAPMSKPGISTPDGTPVKPAEPLVTLPLNIAAIRP